MIGPAADRDEHDIGGERLARALALRRRDADLKRLSLLRDAGHLRAEAELQSPASGKCAGSACATSPSMPGRMRSRNSTTVTSEPSRRQTEPISSPMTPAPTTSSRFGTLFSSSAPVEVTTRSSSISTPGSGVEFGAGGDDDRLRLDASAWRRRRRSPRPCPAAAMRPCAVKEIDLVLLEEEGDAVDIRFHRGVLVRQHPRQIELRLRP